MRRSLIVLGALVAALVVVTFTIRDAVVLDLLFSLLLFSVLGQSWNWISGYAGQISFAHAIFYGCGAYAAALTTTVWHISPWLAFPVGALAAGLLALAVGFPTLALRGHYFSIATIAIGALVDVFVRNTSALGRATGFELPIATGFANLQFAEKTPYVLVALALFALTQGLTVALEHSKLGYYLRALRANHAAAASVGIAELRWKLVAFCGSAALASAAGVLYAQYTLYVDPGTISLSTSIDIALIGVVGGLGTIWGPPIGALIYVVLSKFVSLQLGGSGKGYDLVIYGLLIVLIATLQPRGIAGSIVDALRRRRAREIGV